MGKTEPIDPAEHASRRNGIGESFWIALAMRDFPELEVPFRMIADMGWRSPSVQKIGICKTI